MEETNIKAVKMTRRIRDEIYAQTRDLSRAELIAFYKQDAKKFGNRAKTSKSKRSAEIPVVNARKTKIKIAA